MRHIREKIVNIQIVLYICPQNYTLEEANDPSTLPPLPQNLIPPGKFCPVYPKKGQHYDHWYHVVGNYSTDSI